MKMARSRRSDCTARWSFCVSAMFLVHAIQASKSVMHHQHRYRAGKLLKSIFGEGAPCECSGETDSTGISGARCVKWDGDAPGSRDLRLGGMAWCYVSKQAALSECPKDMVKFDQDAQQWYSSAPCRAKLQEASAGKGCSGRVDTGWRIVAQSQHCVDDNTWQDSSKGHHSSCAKLRTAIATDKSFQQLMCGYGDGYSKHCPKLCNSCEQHGQQLAPLPGQRPLGVVLRLPAEQVCFSVRIGETVDHQCAELCCAQCNAHAGCRSWVLDWRLDYPKKHECVLFDRKPTARERVQVHGVKGHTVFSGEIIVRAPTARPTPRIVPSPSPYVAPPPPPQCITEEVQPGVCLPGGGFQHFHLGAACGAFGDTDPAMARRMCSAMCCTKCSSASRCVAWTFDYSATCRLLESVPPRESHELNEKCFSGLMRDKPGGQIIDHGYDASLRAHPLHARIDSMPSTTTAAPGASEQKWLNGGGHAVCRSVIEDGICVSGAPPALKTVNMRKLRKNSKVLSSCEASDDDDDDGHGTMSCAQQCCAMCGTEPLCRSWSFDQQKNCHLYHYAAERIIRTAGLLCAFGEMPVPSTGLGTTPRPRHKANRFHAAILSSTYTPSLRLQAKRAALQVSDVCDELRESYHDDLMDGGKRELPRACRRASKVRAEFEVTHTHSSVRAHAAPAGAKFDKVFRGTCTGKNGKPSMCGKACPASLRNMCRAVVPAGCMECAMRKGITTDPKLGCDHKHAQYVCSVLATAAVSAIRRSAAKAVYAQPAFKPSGGFESTYGEMAACVLDKAEMAIDVAYLMATCQKYDLLLPSRCYANVADDLPRHLRLCCVGNEKQAHEGSVALCKKAVLPAINLLEKFVRPRYAKCVKNPATCDPMRQAKLQCYRIFREFAHAKKIDPHISFVGFFFQEPKTSHACLQLLRSPELPLLDVFEHLTAAATKLYHTASSSTKTKENRDMTPVASRLLGLCTGADLAAAVFLLGDKIGEGDGARSACAAMLVSFMNPHDPDLGNDYDER